MLSYQGDRTMIQGCYLADARLVRSNGCARFTRFLELDNGILRQQVVEEEALFDHRPQRSSQSSG